MSLGARLSQNPRAVRVGAQIRLARGALGISQAELARRIGHKHKSDIGAWESGARFPSRDKLEKVDAELNQDGRLLRIAGYTLEESALADEIRAVIDAHVVAMLADLDRLLGR